MPLGILTVVVLAVILFGITTATESAAVGAAGAFLLAFHARTLDHLGEAIVARYLADQGWRLLDRNWRPGPGSGLRGELDTYTSMTRALVALLQDARLLDERRATELLAALLQ